MDDNTLQPVEQINVTKESRKRMFPTWIDLFVILALFFVTQIATIFIFSMLSIDMPNTSILDSLATMELRAAEFDLGYKIFMWSVISQPLMLILVLIYRQIRGGKLWGRVRWSVRGLNPSVLMWGLLMLFSVVIVIEPLMQLLPQPQTGYGRGLYMLASLLIIAPIFEEILCRGVIFEAVRAKHGSWAACIISSLIFGIMHIEPQFILNAFIIGLVLCYLYLRTRSLFAPIIIHSVNNVFAYFLLTFGLSSLSLSQLIDNQTIYIAVYSVAVVILLISAINVVRQINRLDNEERAKREAQEIKNSVSQ